MTRTPGDFAFYAALVDEGGSVSNCGSSVNLVNGAVRPVVVLRCSGAKH